MAENTGIEWTDSTFNPVIGCTKVSPGCANCYAERDMDNRLKVVHWGPSGTRVKTSPAYWNLPLKWNQFAEQDEHPHRVFCGSLCDVFGDWQGPILDHKGNVLSDSTFEIAGPTSGRLTMNDIRRDLFELIDATPMLTWLLLTKRPENIRHMWLPNQENHWTDQARHNAWIGVSVENQEQAEKRIPELLKCRDLSPVLFLSCEPLLSNIDLANIQVPPDHNGVGPDAIDDNLLDSLSGELFIGETGKFESTPSVDWVIVGGESGPCARPMNLDWARSIIDQCNQAHVPVFMKQLSQADTKDFKDFSQFPKDLQIRLFPND